MIWLVVLWLSLIAGLAGLWMLANVVYSALVAASKDDDRTGRDIWR